MIETNDCLNDVPFDKLLHLLLPYVLVEEEGDLPDPVILSAIRNSAIEFMRLTQFVRRTITIDVQCHVDEYPLELDDCYYVISVRRVTHCGEALEPIHEEDTGNFLSRDSHRPHSRHLFYLSDRNWLVIEPVPEETVDAGIQAYVTVAPSPDSCGMPREVYNEYGRIIADGALAELLLLKGQPWYDAGQAVLRQKRFAAAVEEAKVRALKGFVTGKHKGSNRQRGYRRGIR